jgi:8-oxo-dGTP pyrophosphatase MutT (NUDIX family)
MKKNRFIPFMMHWLWRMRYRVIYWLGGKVVGARALVLRENEILLVKHTYGEGWYTIGGEVDKNELPIDAAKREVLEEAGVKVQGNPELLGIYQSNYLNRDDYVFLYVIKSFTLEKASSPEIEEYRWFPLDALPQDISAATQRRINEYLKRIPVSGVW